MEEPDVEKNGTVVSGQGLEDKRFIETAAGRRKADLVIHNARVVDVFNHAVAEGSVALCGNRIAGVGIYEGKIEIDADGKYVLPGLIDSHVHIESSLVGPESFAKAVLPHGTTTIIADPHEIGNVCGKNGVDYMLRASEHIPLNMFFMLPSCVPATPYEHSGAVLGAADLKEFIHHPRVLGLGEVMNYEGTVFCAADVMEKIDMVRAAGKRIDGHCPMCSGSSLTAYAAAGIRTDHECSTPEELKDRLARGMYVQLRQGSAARELRTLLGGVTPQNSRRCLFCTDDRQPEDILSEGHIDNHLRIAVESGMDPVTAIQMATLNAAECYGLDNLGAIAPGYRADLVLVDDLKQFRVSSVFVGGEQVVKEGVLQTDIPVTDSSTMRNTVHVGLFTRDSLTLSLSSDHAHVIRIVPQSLITEHVTRRVFPDAQSRFVCTPDLIKIAVVERHSKTGNTGLGIIENYGLKNGAIATSIAHDSHNIIVAGDNDEDMVSAVEEIIRMNGGIALCSSGKLLDSLELPIAGLMSDRDAGYVSERLRNMHHIAYDLLRVNQNIDPFTTLSFMALPVIPALKITDRGLFDVQECAFINISLQGRG